MTVGFDIGGTNARFALADTGSPTPLQLDTVHGFAVADFPSLAEAAQHYLDTTGHGDGAVIRRAVFDPAYGQDVYEENQVDAFLDALVDLVLILD